ncbi:hypothetical protein ACIRL2_43690 [Embleya sp. NPDC127516]|uniref:hypothetical protein n=1 Tax=Embleya sp. NPDC127516 TaxID=3363990 RepID=UPI0038264822
MKPYLKNYRAEDPILKAVGVGVGVAKDSRPTPFRAPRGITPDDPFYRQVLAARSVAEVGDLLHTKFGQDVGEVVVDITGADLYIAKFVAMAAGHWSGLHPGHDNLGYLGIKDTDWGNDLYAAHANPAGAVLLHATNFRGEGYRDRLAEGVVGGIEHVIDDSPEYAAITHVLHELSHIEAYRFGGENHSFMPNILKADRKAARRAKPRFKNTSSRRTAQHPAFARFPRLRLLDDKAIAEQISPYAATGKEETYAVAKAKVYIAGDQAGDASLMVAGLGPSIAAEIAAAPGLVVTFNHLRHHLDEVTGLETTNLVARRREIENARALAEQARQARQARAQATPRRGLRSLFRRGRHTPTPAVVQSRPRQPLSLSTPPGTTKPTHRTNAFGQRVTAAPDSGSSVGPATRTLRAGAVAVAGAHGPAVPVTPHRHHIVLGGKLASVLGPASEAVPRVGSGVVNTAASPPAGVGKGDDRSRSKDSGRSPRGLG